MGRPRTGRLQPGETRQVSINLDGAVIQKLDRQAELLADHTKLPVTRTDVIRQAIDEYLAARERERGRSKKK